LLIGSAWVCWLSLDGGMTQPRAQSPVVSWWLSRISLHIFPFLPIDHAFT